MPCESVKDIVGGGCACLGKCGDVPFVVKENRENFPTCNSGRFFFKDIKTLRKYVKDRTDIQ